jgi:hypothetical protein
MTDDDWRSGGDHGFALLGEIGRARIAGVAAARPDPRAEKISDAQLMHGIALRCWIGINC